MSRIKKHRDAVLTPVVWFGIACLYGRIYVPLAAFILLRAMEPEASTAKISREPAFLAISYGVIIWTMKTTFSKDDIRYEVFRKQTGPKGSIKAAE
jgi:hypothetical protein